MEMKIRGWRGKDGEKGEDERRARGWRGRGVIERNIRGWIGRVGN